MGRTKRKRNKHRHETNNVNLGHDETSIGLRKWLKQNNFTDPLNLQLRNFSDTGRGVTSKASVQPSDVLIKIPFDLLITFDTVRKSHLMSYLNGKMPLTIQSLLALFLIMEKHKGDQSEWKSYIDSLPYPEPFLPWMSQSENMKFYPEDLRTNALKLRRGFENSVAVVQKSLTPEALCSCCKQSLKFLLDKAVFKWAYTIVNTRAVYIDPEYVLEKDKSHISLLADDPFLALCPYLDLINHHHGARTKATVIHIKGQKFYQLTTMTGFKKYQQIFISYGAHNNENLLLEYGFFIPGNVFDSIRFLFQEVIDVLKLSLEERQYKLIKNYGFKPDEVYINENGVSYILKAIIFVAYYPKVTDYSSFIFTNKYPSDFDVIVAKSTRVLLNFKLEEFKRDVIKFVENNRTGTEGTSIVKDFLEHKVAFAQRLLSILDENKCIFR